jgi:hypothetical protein
MNYEVFELLEVGAAGATILDKDFPFLDELMEPSGREIGAVEE